MLDEHLATPFGRACWGVDVTMTNVDLTVDDMIVAMCTRGRSRQRTPLLDLPLPEPPPDGAE